MTAAGRAMVLRRNAPISERPLEPIAFPRPDPGPGEVLVRNAACAICRTDLHVVEGDLPALALPVVPGHQVVGVVEAAGDGCERFAPGARVGVAWLGETCGACRDCSRGAENLCRRSSYTGYHVNGGYATWTVAKEAFVYPIPDAFGDAEAAPLLCAGIIGYRALRRADLPEGGRLGLYGFGSSAHVVLQIALHRGCDVFVVTRGAGHRELARRMGARWVGEASETPPALLDSAIVFAPAGEVVPLALRGIRPGGTVALAGIHMSPIPEMEYGPHLFHEKNLRSVEANTRDDGAALLAEAAAIPIRPRTTCYPLERANEALADLAADRIDGTGVLLCGTGAA